MTIGELLKKIRNDLSESLGMVAVPQSEDIISHLTGLTRTQIYTSYNSTISEKHISNAELIVHRRLRGEPLPYILNNTFFYAREYIVTPKVLIPRPDTEVLIEEILSNEPPLPRKFLDIGTGSGIIVSTLTEQRPWRGLGVDISIDALHIAQKNNKSSYLLLCGDRLEAFSKLNKFDFLVSNPPYISYSELEQLDPEVRDKEPSLALYGGIDGLDFYRYFARQAGNYIKPGGNMYCEIGYNQSLQCKHLFEEQGWQDIKVINDLGNNPRVIIARVPEK